MLGSEKQHASKCQISWQSVKSLLRYSNLQIFKNGTACMMDLLYISSTYEVYLGVFIMVQNLIEINAVVRIISMS